MFHLHQNGRGDQHTAINLSENFRVAKKNEVIERTGVGNDDHACGSRGLRCEPVQRGHVFIKIV